ncbi:MAG TPA: aminotransferase class I/II-fold pyridoxal phosphate-dependent enzyme [Solirubrobacteraceae bacterium]|jgi:glutamate/tyrosine decarboxylase-like PLP-dependent enzyme|nr:aminotransferase class I/II-fold pyridoxal phosphate-dependent enzyme [Solirubrobacteraceae bacterium]
MKPGDRTDALGMPAGEMRRLGYWVVDRVVEHYESGADGPSIRTGDAAELQSLLGGPVPEEPDDPGTALEALVEIVLSHMQHGDHPRYFARVPGPSSFAGVLGDWLGTGFNALASSWGGGSGPATVELVVLDWIRTLLGMPTGTEGVILSGGSLSNMTALAAARGARGPGVAYVSDQTHASVRRGLEALGFSAEQIRTLPTDARFRLTAEALAGAVRRDREQGEQPRFVVATAGTTNTGAVDELDAIADVCASERLWFHVDGAYGAPAAFCDAGRAALAGLERADSLTLDPHKWLFTPYDAGILLVRHPGVLEGAFSMRPEYLADVRSDSGAVSFGDRSLELSRRPRALKLWMMFRTYGLGRIRTAIERGIMLAERAQAMIEADSGWECVTPAQLGIVTFTHPGWDAREHTARVAALTADGFATLTSTTLRGHPVLRLCTINPRTTDADISETLARLAG